MGSKKKHTSIAIIIPMYNEEIGAKKCIKTVIPEIKKLNVLTKLFVVNDGSKDRTSQILDNLGEKYKDDMVVVNRDLNQGYGAALQTGIKKAYQCGFDFCIFMDSDLTNHPSFLKKFVELIDSGYDCVKASRYIPGGMMENVPFYRQIISKLGNSIASTLFGVGIRDCTNGFRMVRLELIKDIKFKQNNFSIIVEELYYLKCRRAKITEIPNILTSRINTKTSFRYTPRIFWDYFKYAFRASLI